MPKPFNPLTDELPKEIDAEFDRAIKAAQADDAETLLDACHKLEAHFGFPAPNELVKKAEIPGGMYSNICLLYTSTTELLLHHPPVFNTPYLLAFGICRR